MTRFINLVGAGCLSALVANSAFAVGEPIPFDGFTASAGAITAGCPLVGGVQAICVDGIEDDGMLQRKITLPSGPNQGDYIQFILTESGVSGDAAADPFSVDRGNLLFSNEDFVKQNHRAGGIASKQTIIESVFLDPDTENRFVNDVIYKYGTWAQSANNPWVTIHQEAATVDYGGVDPVETASLTTDILNNGPLWDSAAIVLLKGAIDIGDGTNVGIQKFQFDKRAGGYNYLPFGGTSGLPGAENISWAQFETITAMWVGLILETGETFADQTFGYTRYENKDQLTSASYLSLADPEAASWPVPFATGPVGSVFADPVETIAGGMGVIVSPTATVAAPQPLQPTVAAGTGSSDTTVVQNPLYQSALLDGYDGWRVDNGVFTLDACPLTLPDSCGSPLINVGGMMQRIITVGGVDYVHSIVTEDNATGDPENADFSPDSLTFNNETFVRYNAFVNGLIGQLHLAEQNNAFQTNNPVTVNYTLPSAAGEFIYNTIIKTGWGHGGALDPILVVDQSILVDETVGYLDTSSMYQQFSMKRGETQADTSMDMLTAVGYQATVSSGFNAPIVTATSVRGGAFQNTAHDGDGIGVDDPFLLDSIGGNISWSEGEAIQATWVIAEYPTSNQIYSAVNSLSYTNLSTGERIVSTETDGNLGTDPFDASVESWDPVFGTAPIYTDPFVPTP